MFKVVYGYFGGDGSAWNHLCSFISVEYKFKNTDLCGGAIWFLVVLFWSKEYLRMLSLMKSYKSFVCVLLFGALISWFYTRLTTMVIPIGISQALVCSLFVFAGFKLKEMNVLEKIVMKINIRLLLLILLVILYFCPYFAVATRINGYRYGIFSIIISIFISTLLISLVKLLYEKITMPLFSTFFVG